jgi:hypothetical protein
VESLLWLLDGILLHLFSAATDQPRGARLSNAQTINTHQIP